MLASKGLEAEFPLFTAVHKVTVFKFKCHQHVYYLLLHFSGLYWRTGARAVGWSDQESPSSCVIQQRSMTIIVKMEFICVFPFHMFLYFLNI